MARGCPPRTCASEALFPGRQTKLADAPGAAHPLGGRRATAGPPLSFYAASGGSKGCAQAHEKLGDGEGVCCGDGSAKRTARRARHAWEWRVGGCGRAQGQGLGGRPCKIARCAANMAADGRKVLGRDGAASPGDQGGAWQSQGRNLTALRPAGGAGSRENLLRIMPWYPCNSINTAIREISPRAFQQYILHSIDLLWPYLRACGTFSAI